ncbi:MAG: SAVED domain-containing protein [Planctomycetota bacterium]|nr:SAVED domain-containing protein [Planctomycetota bacterium]
MITAGYDPFTLNHWLWWKVRCLEADGTAFQKLFEEVIKRTDPQFMSIRSYGNIGDRKCDGLFYQDGIVFQVYSPDEYKLANTTAKIEEDLGGAVAHWGEELTRWVFVYNVRRGLAPDIPLLLKVQEKKYPEIEIVAQSSDQLWEQLRALPLQQRCEVLGPPVGYEHLFLANSDSAITRRRLRDGYLVLVHDVMAPINVHDAIDALAPKKAIGPPIVVRPDLSGEDWGSASKEQGSLLAQVLERSRGLVPRFAIFSLSPIPLAVHLGFVLSDRVEVFPHQYDRLRKTWKWPDPDATEVDCKLSIEGLPTTEVPSAENVIIRVSLSEVIAPADTRSVVPRAGVEIDIGIQEPGVNWLRTPAQLARLSATFGQVLEAIRRHVPARQRIHLFYAGPTGGAVVVGQAINPRMDPPVITYQYSRQRSPRYRRAITLEEG